jgi:hypothetical protein
MSKKLRTRNPRRTLDEIPINEIWFCHKCKRKYKRTSTLSIKKHQLSCIAKKRSHLKSDDLDYQPKHPILTQEVVASPSVLDIKMDEAPPEASKIVNNIRVEPELPVISYYPFKDQSSPSAMLTL